MMYVAVAEVLISWQCYLIGIIHTYITICIARCVDSTEYMSNQRCWRQLLGGQLLASKVISFQVALKAVQ